MNYVFYAAVDRAGPVYTAPLGRGLFSGMRRRAVALHVAVLPGWRNRLLDVRSARRCICGEGRSQPPRAVPAVPVGPLRTGRPWVCESRSTANGGTSGSTSELCKFAARMQRWSFVGGIAANSVAMPVPRPRCSHSYQAGPMPNTDDLPMAGRSWWPSWPADRDGDKSPLTTGANAMVWLCSYH